MTLRGAFTGTNDGFFSRFDGTRRSLADAAFRLKLDAHEAHSWGFFVFGAIGYRLLHRTRHDETAREASLRGYAQRAVWLTHFMDDPAEIDATKGEILKGNIDDITVEELDAFLDEHVARINLGSASDEQQATMRAGVRRHAQERSTSLESVNRLSQEP